VNLALEVLGRRADGYHEVRTILQRVALHDTLRARLARRLTLRTGHAALQADNLILRAAEALRAAHPDATAAGAQLSLRKRIPVAAGLGGGSSDAATALRLLCRLWALALTDDALAAIAARLGSDVPFFLGGPTALASSRGEELTPLPPPASAWLVIVVPRLTLADKTRRMYAALTPDDFSDGGRVAAVQAGLAAGQPLHRLPLWNTFSAVARRLFPEAAAAERALYDAGATTACLCGAGPAWFAPCPTRAAAGRIVAALRRRGWTAFATWTEDGRRTTETR
jgi:4-diphosphocytidyl-2-C-methyl-D-erythritol kinase